MTPREAAELAAETDHARRAADVFPDPADPALTVDTPAGPLDVDADLLAAWTDHGWPSSSALAALAAAQLRGETV